jgi:hypothetical protein
MTFERRYNPELDHQSVSGCLNDASIAGRPSHALALSAASASVGPLVPGIYMVFLDGLDPTRTVVLKTGGETVTAELPTAVRRGERDSALLPGSLIGRVRVLLGRQYVAASLTQGTGTLYLVPLVTT